MTAGTQTAAAAGRVGDEVRRAADSPWLDRAARIGFVGRGLVYMLIAYLAAQIALGHPDQPANKQGALRAIADRSYGKVVLVVLAVGLAGYALWRFSEAAFGTRHESDPKKRTAKRLGSAGKGAIYAAFCASTVSVLAGGGGGGAGGGGEQQPREWTARALGLPAGRAIAVLGGLVVMGVAAYMAWRGVARKFEKHLDRAGMSDTVRTVTAVVGTVGVTARAVVLGLAGLLVAKAGFDYEPDEAKGVDGTLRTIADRSYGKALLLVAAVGLLAFGLYSWCEARYRRI